MVRDAVHTQLQQYDMGTRSGPRCCAKKRMLALAECACLPLVYLLRVVHAVARVLVTVQYALPQIRLVHAEKHLRAVFVVLNLARRSH